MTMFCTYLRDITGEPAGAFCQGGEPRPIPEGEDDPRTARHDSPKVRLGEFDGELGGKPGTMIGLWLCVEDDPYWLYEGDHPFWLDSDGFPKEAREISFKYATSAQAKKQLDSAFTSAGMDFQQWDEDFLPPAFLPDPEAAARLEKRQAPAWESLKKFHPKLTEKHPDYRRILRGWHNGILLKKPPRKRNPDYAEAKYNWKRIIEEICMMHGLYAPVADFYCLEDEFDKAIEEALVQAQPLLFMPGFYLDRRVNRIGSIGWEFLVGDLDSAMDRLSG